MTYTADYLIEKRKEKWQESHDIEDTRIYYIFKYRFIDNYSWNRVAMKIGNDTADNVRMTVNNYLKKHK